MILIIVDTFFSLFKIKDVERYLFSIADLLSQSTT